MVKNMITLPTHLDHEPYLTEWHADVEPGMQIWIQSSKDQENPRWVRLGELFEHAILTKKKSLSIKDWID